PGAALRRLPPVLSPAVRPVACRAVPALAPRVRSIGDLPGAGGRRGGGIRAALSVVLVGGGLPLLDPERYLRCIGVPQTRRRPRADGPRPGPRRGDRGRRDVARDRARQRERAAALRVARLAAGQRVLSLR